MVTLAGPVPTLGRVVLDHAGLRWRWLPASNLRRLGQNLELPAIRDRLGPFDRTTVRERLLALAHGEEWQGTSLTLVVERDDEPLGLAGVVLRDGSLSTRTYLHPDLQGQDVVAAVARVARTLSHLTGLPPLAAVDRGCVRVPPLDGPAGLGPPLGRAETDALRRLVEVTPFGGHLRAAPGRSGTGT